MMFEGYSTSGFAAPIVAAKNFSLMPCCTKGLQVSPSKEKSVCNSKSLKVKFTEAEDSKLRLLVMQFGAKDWIKISQLMETRNPRQCRERWNNYINPALRTDPWTPEEDKILESKYNEYGPKWNKISKFFVNRADNSIRNRWMMIARRRAKQRKSPISPAPQPSFEGQQFTAPVVNEIRVAQVKPPMNSFELLGEVKQTPYEVFEPDVEFDAWSDLSFY